MDESLPAEVQWLNQGDLENRVAESIQHAMEKNTKTKNIERYQAVLEKLETLEKRLERGKFSSIQKENDTRGQLQLLELEKEFLENEMNGVEQGTTDLDLPHLIDARVVEFFEPEVESDSESEEQLELESGVDLDFDDSDNIRYLERQNTYQQLPENDSAFDSKFVVPGSVWKRLFKYQKTAVRWMWSLYQQRMGGIIGDEMGLGKTMQTIGFLSGCVYSLENFFPILILCPATVMTQWIREIHKWYPPLKVFLMHGNCSFRSIAARAKDSGHIIITTYSTFLSNNSWMCKINWKTVILDEGHCIRNPDSEITLAVKRLNTPHRYILSGTPMQNNLVELWSLFDFIAPGRLGTLPIFQEQFAIPIQMGGYANASGLAVQTAYKCAVGLRDVMKPLLLRRLKVDVQQQLPIKEEKVVFCKLTKMQTDFYKSFLQSDDMESIKEGKRHVLYGIDHLRKICNHPKLVDNGIEEKEEYSGKLKVLMTLLRQAWHGHKVLIFSQTKQMLNIIEKCVKNEWQYLRMDGSTPIRQRPHLVKLFNETPEIYIFLLTTKVGGIGLNLTGADRVVLFDPDWNPANDAQARERAYRLGQSKNVIIYRLVLTGTIEEKIYHRQLFKTFLTDKILKDPKQARFFQVQDLYDLFSLDEDNENTVTMLKHLENEIDLKLWICSRNEALVSFT